MNGAMRTRLAGMVAAALVVAGPAAVRAETAQWSLTVSPSSVAVGATTTFALTATNEDPQAAELSSSEIGCVVVDVPANFSVANAKFTGSNAGNSWTAGLAGNRVTVQAGGGGGRLEFLQWLRFTVEATALSAGSLAWTARAFRDQGCTGSGASVTVPPHVLVTGPAVAATPIPTPIPTAVPTLAAAPKPTPTTAPIVTLPPPPVPEPSSGVLPTASPSPTPIPDRAGSQPDLSAAATRTPAFTPRAISAAGDENGEISGGGGGVFPALRGDAAADPGSSATGAQTADRPPRVVFDGVELDMGLGSIDVLAGAAVWVVPAATIAVPGLLLLLLVALQAAGALAWIPAVRKLRGEDSRAAP